MVEENIDTTIENEEDDNVFNDDSQDDGEGEGQDLTPEQKADARADKAEKALKTSNRKYDKLVGRNKTLEDQAAKSRPDEKLTAEEKKEKDAEKYLDDKVDKRLAEKEKAKETKDAKALEQFSDELDEVLEENTTLTEKEVLDLIEEFAEDKIKLSPRQAAARLLKKDADKNDKAKEKPNMPVSKRGTGEVKTESTKEELEAEKGLSFHEKLTLRKKRFLAKNQD